MGGLLLRSLIPLIVVTLIGIFGGAPARGQQYDPSLYSGMQWRLVGTHRAGRVTTVAGIPGQPAIYYFGTPGGGLWKTTSAGRVWQPIFDAARAPSIGALAVAPSDPNVIYVGTGEQLKGDGVYKSTDGGSTWANVGLRDAYAISSIIVDPHDSNTVLAAAVGGPTPGQARGVFKTTDGGKTWNRALFKDEQTSVVDMCATPEDSRVIYAATITRLLNTNDAVPVPPLSGIFKSTDSGSTWQALAGRGLPEQPRGRIGVAAAGGGGRRVYAIMNQGFYRSDDGGDNWRQITDDPRVVGSGYFSRAFVDPKSPDTVYVMQTTMYRSKDGGRTFDAYKGAPSGEDQHVLWIAPDDPQRMILGSDQGAIISVNGGLTWTSWFNQPTGEMYHVKTDNSFPYRLYASQQDSGSVVVNSRSDFGQITYRDWFSSGSFESGYIAPDPADPNLIYSIGWFGSVLRLDHSTGQISTVFVPGAKYRYTWETPLVYSPADPKTLYVGMQNVLKTSDGASTWHDISPDLTERADPAAVKDGKPAAPIRGVIQVIAPSAMQASEIWVGTSTGLVQLTRDGGATWQNVTPTIAPQKSAIISIEASPSEVETAYAVAFVRNDSHPYIYRTRDAGKTWQKIVAGLAEAGSARVVREDPARKGLVYAGTEKGVHVSFDGGDHWQNLQLNLPTTSVRDLAVHGSDLVAATYGRGLWILDDLSPLREVNESAARAQVYLYRPETALRVRWDNHPDTPIPADTPAGQNPPEGAIIDYYLKSNISGEITLEIRDEHGNTVRRFSSAPPSATELPGNAPDYWFAPPDVLSTKAGAHRFVWNLRWPDPAVQPYSFYGKRLDYIEYTLPDHAVPGQTPRHQPPGPLAVPGTYEVVLTVGGQTYHRPLAVVLDPRVKASRADLEAQLSLAARISSWMAKSYNAYNAVTSLRSGLAQSLRSLAGKPDARSATDIMIALDKELELLQDGTSDAPGFGPVNRDLSRYMTMIESGDMRPPRSAHDNATASCEWLSKSFERWRKVKVESLPTVNRLLAKYKLRSLEIMTFDPGPVCGS